MIKNIFNQYADPLYFDNGIWYSRSSKPVSYPGNGNESCFQLEDKSFWFRHRNNCILAAVEMYSASQQFFDIGGGNGFVSAALQNAGKEVVLIEPGQEGCFNARQRNIDNIICGLLEDIPLNKSSIGACGFFDVIEHIEDDLGLLKALYPLVKHDGEIYVTVPAYSFLWSQEDIDAGHYRRYSVRTIKDALHKAGFTTIYSTYLFSFLPVPIFFSRTFAYLLKLKNKPVNHQKDHQSNKTGSIVEKMMDWELQCIRNKKSISFGSSCFIVAKKR